LEVNILKLLSNSHDSKVEEAYCQIIHQGKSNKKLKCDALTTKQPISFLGDIDPKTGEIIGDLSDSKGSLKGKTVKKKLLVTPGGKGSSVGSYVLFDMARLGTAPSAILITGELDPVIAMGVVLADIPTLQPNPDSKSVDWIQTGTKVEISFMENGKAKIKKK